MLVYYFKYIYKDEAMTTIAMLLLLGVAMLCVPLSVLVAKRIGKKRTYQLALGILAVSCLAMFFAHTLGMIFTFCDGLCGRWHRLWLCAAVCDAAGRG